MSAKYKTGNRKRRYLDSNLPISVRVRDLMSRMTLEEKVRQLYAIDPDGVLENVQFSDGIMESGNLSLKKLEKSIGGSGIGNIGIVVRPFKPKEGADLANKIQKFNIEHTRLGIPIIIHDEGLHGLLAKGATSYPQSIGLASTWNPELIKKIAIAIGKETCSRGIHQVLSPTINIARDVRCGRTEETYGEDPYLTSLMGAAFVRGVQSQKVVATPKHFAANFVGDGGRDSNAVHFSERLLREIYFPAFEACVREAGALSIMPAYGSINGCPSSCDRWLLTDILRKEWKFKGFVVSDYGSVAGIYNKHNVATKPEAGKKALEAGMDVELPYVFCFGYLMDLVKSGELSEKIIDESVARVLTVKFWLGLFENPYVDPDSALEISNCDEHRRIALESARESIVLLKNNRILPLHKKLKTIAVIGPNAAHARLGGYSATGIKVITPLEGIRKKMLSQGTKVYFAQGCSVKGDSNAGFKKAIDIAKKSDVAIMFMGNDAIPSGDKGTEGENNDRCNLDLPGVQEDLIREICKTNAKVVVVLINGSAITMNKWLNDVPAVVEAWYPGQEGGHAIADILFGDYNPGGKLPITFPISTGQLPLYYNYKPTGRLYDYVDLRGKQMLFPFGYGLSYTIFDYKNLQIRKEKTKGKLQVKVKFDIRNIGRYKGDEIVQLYIHDEVSSLSRPVKELKRFKRITLLPKEKKNVQFTLEEKDLSFLGPSLKPVLEPGRFEIMLGSSSEDIRLKDWLVI